MSDYKKQMQEINTEIELYKLFERAERFSKRIETNQCKIERLEKHPEKLTNLSLEEVSDYLKKLQDELQYIRKYATSFYSAYEKLCKFYLAISRRQNNDKSS